GEFVVIGGDGKEVGRFPAARDRASDRVSAVIKLPVPGAMKIRFEPAGIVTRASEALGRGGPAEPSLNASNCRLRGVVLAPATDEVLVAGTPAVLAGEIRNSAGKSVGAGDLNGTKPVFAVETGGKTKTFDAAFEAAGQRVTASIKLD